MNANTESRSGISPEPVVSLHWGSLARLSTTDERAPTHRWCCERKERVRWLPLGLGQDVAIRSTRFVSLSPTRAFQMSGSLSHQLPIGSDLPVAALPTRAVSVEVRSSP